MNNLYSKFPKETKKINQKTWEQIKMEVKQKIKEEEKKMNEKDEIKAYLLRDINEIFEKEDVDNVYMHREGDEYTIKIYVNEFTSAGKPAAHF
jgi:predicted NAD-dependent protein-ADP-ribosyltransferase YbiA (DUF1768 family)